MGHYSPKERRWQKVQVTVQGVDARAQQTNSKIWAPRGKTCRSLTPVAPLCELPCSGQGAFCCLWIATGILILLERSKECIS